MYLEIFKDIEDAEKVKKQNAKGATIKRNLYGKPGPPRFAFCECRNHHLVGIIQDQKYYFTDVSGLRMMFPQGHYEDWSSQFWSKGYKEAFELQSKLNIKRAQESNRHGYKAWAKAAQDPICCELCKKMCPDHDEFILHCSRDQQHKDLIR